MARAFAVLALLSAANTANSTYSIVGVDRAESLAGISIASCVGALDLDIAVGMAPGSGVVAAQASVDSQFRGRTLAVQLLGEGQPAEAVVDRITVTAVDPNFQARQYGIAAITSGGSSEDWTGTNTGAWSGGTHGFDASGRMPYAAQGNILTGPGCVAQSEAGFIADPDTLNNATDADKCYDLPARLMRALIAGTENGEGDTRCTSRNPPVPVDSAYIRVDLPSGEPWLLLSVVDTYPLSAVDVLYVEYLLWRAANPCGTAGGNVRAEETAWQPGLEAFRGNATARSFARSRMQAHGTQAAETYRRIAAAAHGNISI